MLGVGGLLCCTGTGNNEQGVKGKGQTREPETRPVGGRNHLIHRQSPIGTCALGRISSRSFEINTFVNPTLITVVEENRL